MGVQVISANAQAATALRGHMQLTLNVLQRAEGFA